MRAILPNTKRLLSTLVQVTDERNALAKERDALKAQLQQFGIDVSSLEEARSADPVIAPGRAFIDQINELTGRVNELTGECNALTGRNNELTHQVNVLTGERNDLVSQVNNLTGERNALAGRLHELTRERDGTPP
jgi:chromosome segregation ATPase